MKFTFISAMSGYPWGGSEELWSRTASALHGWGHKVSISVQWWPKLSQNVISLEHQGMELTTRKAARTKVSSRIWRRITRTSTEESDRQWLRSQNATLVVISQGGISDGLGWMRRCIELDQPFAVIVQCNSESWWPRDEKAREMAEAYVKARKVYCVSRHNLELLEMQLGCRLPNGAVTWNPFNVRTDQTVEWPNSNGILKLACVARLDPIAKGQDVLFSVLASPKWRARAIELNLFGAGPFEGNLKRLAESLGLTNVHFAGHVSDIGEVWKTHHLLVLPSRYEGLPLALVEAMWCARPAVVTNIGGNAEACADGETGFIAEAPTKALLDQALERAWNCRDNWMSMGLEARKRAELIVPADPAKDLGQQLLTLTV